jgi:hypothetical protein
MPPDRPYSQYRPYTDRNSDTDEAPAATAGLPTIPAPRAQPPAVRPTPDVAMYTPGITGGWRDRFRARKYAERLDEAVGVAQAGTRFHQAAERFEESVQSLEYTHKKRVLIDDKVAQEQLELRKQIAQSLMALDDMRSDHETKRVDQARRQTLGEEDFEIARLRLQKEKEDLQAGIDAAGARRVLDRQIVEQRTQVEIARAEEELLRTRAQAERHRTRLQEEKYRQEREKWRDAGAAPLADDMPEALRRPMETAREVKRSTKYAEDQAQRIRDRAARENRELTVEEIEELDVLEDAARVAEDSIRRGFASDI